MVLKTEEIINRNKRKGYNTKWELGFYFNNDDLVPNQVFEYDVDGEFYEKLGKFIMYGAYKKLEIALIGQDKDGHNETCDIIKEIVC